MNVHWPQDKPGVNEYDHQQEHKLLTNIGFKSSDVFNHNGSDEG